MFLHSNLKITAVLLLLCSVSAFAESESNPIKQPQQNNCHFYEFIKNSDQRSDPANQVASFIQNNWVVLENDLARGQGEALTYLRNLALCPYVLPSHLWKDQLKDLPYLERALKFSKLFFSECFCSR